MGKPLFILPGAIISRPKKGFPMITHYGITIGLDNFGRQMVIENSSEFGVRQITLTEFICGEPNYKLRILPNPDQAIRIANFYLGTGYDLFKFNCEHLVNLIKNGRSSSNQVRGGILLSLTAVFLIAKVG